jgi:hypothetical protein
MIETAAREVLEGVRATLEGYAPEGDVAGLDRLVGRLSGSIDALVGKVDAEWLEELRSAWWPLEYVNASVLDADRLALTAAEVRSVSEARDEFLALLIAY